MVANVLLLLLLLLLVLVAVAATQPPAKDRPAGLPEDDDYEDTSAGIVQKASDCRGACDRSDKSRQFKRSKGKLRGGVYCTTKSRYYS